MQHTGFKVAAGLLSALLSSSLFGQVIFQPSLPDAATGNPGTCKRPGAGGAFRFCSGTPATFKLDSVTTNPSRYLASLPIENTLTYRLYCPAFPDSTPVIISFGDTQQSLISSSQSIAEKRRQTVAYSALGSFSYVITPQINYSATYQPSCKMEVISNLSIPNVDMLRTIVDLVKTNYSDLNDLNSSINEAAELPAKWSVIKDAPTTLDGLADSLNNEIAIYQDELNTLSAANKATLSDSDKARLEQLPGIIELYTGMVNDLKNLKTDLGDVGKIASQCESSTTDAFCLDQVSKISKALTVRADLRKADLVELNSFLTAESDRLKTAAITSSNALKRLITKF